MKKEVTKKGRAIRVIRAIRVMRAMRTIRTIKMIRARRKIRAIRKIVLNILLLTINYNLIPCQALQYIKYHLVGTS